jgi:hypothetical protein
VGMLKDKAYANNLQMAEELKENIQKQFQTFPKKELRQVFQNMLMGGEACLQAEGHHFEHLLLFKVKTFTIIAFIDENKYSFANSSQFSASKLVFFFFLGNFRRTYSSSAASYYESMYKPDLSFCIL